MNLNLSSTDSTDENLVSTERNSSISISFSNDGNEKPSQALTKIQSDEEKIVDFSAQVWRGKMRDYFKVCWGRGLFRCSRRILFGSHGWRMWNRWRGEYFFSFLKLYFCLHHQLFVYIFQEVCAEPDQAEPEVICGDEEICKLVKEQVILVFWDNF